MPFGLSKATVLGAAGAAGGAASDVEYVQKHELTSGSSLIQFTGLDTTYDHYLILWRARHTNSTSGTNMNIKMNSDTSNAVWQHRYMYDAPDASSQASYKGATYSGSSTGRVGSVVGTSDGKSAYHWSHGYINITAANDTYVYNNAVGVSGGYKGGTGNGDYGNNGLYYYASTLKFQSQVTSIQITVNDGSYTFGSGSKFVLYGYKAAS